MSLPRPQLRLVRQSANFLHSEPRSGRSARSLSGWPARRAEIISKLNHLIVLDPDAVSAIDAVIDDYLTDSTHATPRRRIGD